MATLHHHRSISLSVLPPLSRTRPSSAIPATLFSRPPLSGLPCVPISARAIRDKRVLGPVRGCATSDSAISPGTPPSSRIFIKGIQFVSLVGYRMDSKRVLAIRTRRVSTTIRLQSLCSTDCRSEKVMTYRRHYTISLQS